MSIFKQKLSAHRRLVLAALLACTLIAVFASGSPQAAAQTRCGTEFYYYSDSSYSCMVGLRGWLPENCGCASYGWGSVTPYREIYDSVC